MASLPASIPAPRRKVTIHQIVSGTRTAPGTVLKAFPSDRDYKCGGPATACLHAWSRLAFTRGKRNGVVAFITSQEVQS